MYGPRDSNSMVLNHGCTLKITCETQKVWMPQLHLSSIRIFRRIFKAPQLTLMCGPVVFFTSAKPFSHYSLYPVLSTHTLPLLCPIKSYPPFRLDASPPSVKTSPALNTGNILSDPVVPTACPLPDSLSCISSGVCIP